VLLVAGIQEALDAAGWIVGLDNGGRGSRLPFNAIKFENTRRAGE
jgi:hypothetical protein